MISLTDLSNISNTKENKQNLFIESLTKDSIEILNTKYNDITSTLESKLKKAAQNNKKRYNVLSFSIHSKNIHNDLHSKINSSGNCYCAMRDKKISQDDIVDNMLGLPRMVYDFCKKHNLCPIITHSMDSGGDNNKFNIIIRW